VATLVIAVSDIKDIDKVKRILKSVPVGIKVDRELHEITISGSQAYVFNAGNKIIDNHIRHVIIGVNMR
jgi:hypothetical protein